MSIAAMQPDPAFANLELQGYVDLLEVRLREFNRPEESRQLAAMDLFDRTPMRWQPANEWLRAFHDGLEPEAQLRLRRAVAELIGRVQPGQFPLQGLVELIGLAGDVAIHEAVPPMLRLVADGGAWSMLRGGPLPHVLAVLKQLHPGGEVYADVCRLLYSPAFADHLAFDAFEILLRARPEQWAESWLLLRSKFRRARRDALAGNGMPAGDDWFVRDIRGLAQGCMASLSPWTLYRGIDHLNAVLSLELADALHPQQPLGMLWRELLASADSPFERRRLQLHASEADDGFGDAHWDWLCVRGKAGEDGVPWSEDWLAWDLQLKLLLQPGGLREHQAEIEIRAQQAPAGLGTLVASVLSAFQGAFAFGEAA